MATNDAWTGRYQDWYNRFKNVGTIDAEKIRTNLQAAGKANPTDAEIAGVMMGQMMDESGASNALTPMYQRYLRSQAERMMNQRAFETMGRQSQNYLDYLAGNRPDEALGEGMDIKGIQSYLGDWVGRGGRVQGDPRAYLNAITDVAIRGEQPDNNTMYRTLYDNPIYQKEFMDQMADYMGYSGPWRSYLQNQVNDAYSAWVGRSDMPATFMEYVKTRLPNWLYGR
jgi:hypothetical protein